MVSYETSVGGKTMNIVEPFTSGYSQLPEEGGLLDQPHRLMTFFDAFRLGDSQAFGKR